MSLFNVLKNIVLEHTKNVLEHPKHVLEHPKKCPKEGKKLPNGGKIHKIRRYRIFFDTYPPHIAPYRQFDPPSPPLNWRRRLWMAPNVL